MCISTPLKSSLFLAHTDDRSNPSSPDTGRSYTLTLLGLDVTYSFSFGEFEMLFVYDLCKRLRNVSSEGATILYIYSKES